MTDSESSSDTAVLARPFLSSPLRTVPTMSCTVIPSPLRDLLATVATHPGIHVDRLDSVQFATAVAYGWAYEHRGRVRLTGAGASHAGMERRGGLLSGSVREKRRGP